MAISRDAILKYIVAIHFIYSSIALIATWLPHSYFMNQVIIMALGLWAIVQREHAIQVELLMVIKFFSFFLDIIAIGMHFNDGRRTYRFIDHSFYFTFSAFFAIFLVILKPIMLIMLNKVRQERLGEAASPTFGGWGSGATHRPEYTPVGGEQTA